MKLFRLSGRKVCERVKTKGFLWKGKHMQIRWLRGQPRSAGQEASVGLYVGLLTSAKLHKSAVKRNRMRRRCREALRIVVREICLDQQLTGEDVTRYVGNPTRTAQRSTRNVQRATFPTVSSLQLLIIPRFSSLSADFRELIADIDRFLSSL